MSGHEFRPVPSGMWITTDSSQNDALSPTTPEGVDPDFYAHGKNFFELTWPLVGNDLPSEVHRRIVGPLDRLGDPSERSAETNRRTSGIVPVHEGLLGAQYHRDNIERIERELLRRLRDAYPEGSWPRGGSATSRMPVLAHEYMAFLFAGRRTLDYLARGVSPFFGPKVHSIKDLAKGLTHGKPADLAAEAREISADVVAQFPWLLTPKGKKNESDRDRAAHEFPVEPASLSVVFFEGVVAIRLADGGRGLLPATRFVDSLVSDGSDRALTQAIDSRLATLYEFCGDLIDVAVRAEERRLAEP